MKTIALSVAALLLLSLPALAQNGSHTKATGGKGHPDVGGGHIPAHGPAPTRGSAQSSHSSAASAGSSTVGISPIT